MFELKDTVKCTFPGWHDGKTPMIACFLGPNFLHHIQIWFYILYIVKAVLEKNVAYKGGHKTTSPYTYVYSGM
jgi:hypothetical protein